MAAWSHCCWSPHGRGGLTATGGLSATGGLTNSKVCMVVVVSLLLVVSLLVKSVWSWWSGRYWVLAAPSLLQVVTLMAGIRRP